MLGLSIFRQLKIVLPPLSIARHPQTTKQFRDKLKIYNISRRKIGNFKKGKIKDCYCGVEAG
jgi:hypothetical protein